MKRTLLLNSLLLIACLSIGQADNLYKSSSKVILEKGHLIRLSLLRDVGSSVAQVGNNVYFEVDSNVVISKVTVIPKGAKAYGTVISTKGAKNFGRQGNLAFTMDKVVLDNGKIISITSNYTAAGRNRTAEAVIGGALIFPAFNEIKGKNVTYKEGDKFIAYVTQDYTF